MFFRKCNFFYYILHIVIFIPITVETAAGNNNTFGLKNEVEKDLLENTAYWDDTVIKEKRIMIHIDCPPEEAILYIPLLRFLKQNGAIIIIAGNRSVQALFESLNEVNFFIPFVPVTTTDGYSIQQQYAKIIEPADYHISLLSLPDALRQKIVQEDFLNEENTQKKLNGIINTIFGLTRE